MTEMPPPKEEAPRDLRGRGRRVLGVSRRHRQGGGPPGLGDALEVENDRNAPTQGGAPVGLAGTRTRVLGVFRRYRQGGGPPGPGDAIVLENDRNAPTRGGPPAGPSGMRTRVLGISRRYRKGGGPPGPGELWWRPGVTRVYGRKTNSKTARANPPILCGRLGTAIRSPPAKFRVGRSSFGWKRVASARSGGRMPPPGHAARPSPNPRVRIARFFAGVWGRP